MEDNYRKEIVSGESSRTYSTDSFFSLLTCKVITIIKMLLRCLETEAGIEVGSYQLSRLPTHKTIVGQKFSF